MAWWITRLPGARCEEVEVIESIQNRVVDYTKSAEIKTERDGNAKQCNKLLRIS